MELVPMAGAEAPAAGSLVEVPAGTAEAPEGATEVPPALEEEEAGFLQLEVTSISPRTPLISRGCHVLFCFLVDRVTPIVPALAPAKALRSGAPATTGRRSARVLLTAASAAETGELSWGRNKRRRRRRRRRRWSPTPLPGTTRRRGPLPMTMLPRVGPIEGATRVNPRARTIGAGDAGKWLCDVVVPGA
jgi:hypothetical protein